MVQVFKFLSPISFNKDEIIYNELDDCDQVIYVMHGQYDVGYTINLFTKMKIRLSCKTIIGVFEVSYNRRCSYIYRAHTDMQCLFITQKDWKILQVEFEEVYAHIRRRGLKFYSTVIAKTLEHHKRKDI